MNLNYFNLPFGAQLLVWTSRIMLNGSCRTHPNKYQLVNIAFKKVGISNGGNLLKEVLFILRRNEFFNLQHTCVQILNNSEINLINCIEENKKEEFNNNYYLEIWDLKDIANSFNLATHKLALAFEKSNLDTDLSSFLLTKNISNTENLITKTLH